MTEPGRYLYGIAEGGQAVSLGPIGIDLSEVYTIPIEGLCAIVHDCSAAPYQSGDRKQVECWVRAHQNVLDEAKKTFGTVIPLSFDVILRSPGAATDAEQVVKDWLREDCDRLGALMEKIRGKDEYAVQVSCDSETMVGLAWAESDEIRQLTREVAAKSSGTAYLYRQKLAKATKTRTEKLADGRFKEYYARIRPHCYDVVVEKTRNDEGKVMLLNLSCLVAESSVQKLARELDGISTADGFSVHFSGPWPPYSFVAKPVVAAGEATG